MAMTVGGRATADTDTERTRTTNRWGIGARGTWEDDAACLGMPGADIFHDREHHEAAKLICDTVCPVKTECLMDAIQQADYFDWPQTRGGAFFKRGSKAVKMGYRSRAHVRENTPMVTCPGCDRQLAGKFAIYPEHGITLGGERCDYSKRQHRFGLAPAEVDILRRVLAGAPKREFRKQRGCTNRMTRYGLLASKDRGTFAVTPEGMHALDLLDKTPTATPNEEN